MSNARNLANLLSPGASTLATASIADNAVTREKNLDADGYSRLLMDASAAGTDVGDNFLLNATDGSASNDGSKILFESATNDPNTLLSTDLTLDGQIKFSQNY